MLNLLALVALIALIVLYVRWFERSNIYFPSRHIDMTPAAAGMEFEDVFFNAADGVKLNGWFLPARGKARGTVLFCHGNAGNISHRTEQARIFTDMGLNVFVFDYRGYGRSRGRPGEMGTYLDGMAAYEYLLGRDDVEKGKIVLYGKSLGGAVATHIAAEGAGDILISDSAFTSTEDMAGEIYPFIPAKLLLTIKYDTVSKVGTVRVPVMVIHSEEDEIVPFRHGRKLFETAREPKEFHVTRGGHNDGIFLYDKEFIEAVDGFLKKHGI